MPSPPRKERSSGSSTDYGPVATDTSCAFVRRHDRRYLREVPNYPLPVDLAELHRQMLRTILLTEVFGTPYCAKLHNPPEKILEMICGPATWSWKCDQYLKTKGYRSAYFTGLDVAPVAPDLSRYGVNWRFVQHDLRKPPMPFGQEEFDLVIVNDGATVMPSARDPKTNPINALKRYLKPGGCIEVLESDYVFRCLQPEPATAVGPPSEHARQAEKTATYIIGSETRFSEAQNPFFADYNRWVEKALVQNGNTVTPCAVMSSSVIAGFPGYEEFGSRRVAIPFSTIRWENEVEAEESTDCESPSIPNDCKILGERKCLAISFAGASRHKSLTSEQAGLRQTALTVAVGLMECLEPMLMQESGMKQDEWDRWWRNMMTDLFENNGTVNGECMEIGVHWARKALA